MESYGLGMSLDNSLMVACGDEVVVAVAHNVVAVDVVVVAVGAAAVVYVWCSSVG